MDTGQHPPRDETLNCPQCGAPTALPKSLRVLTLTCPYCDASFPIPRGLRDAQERRSFQLQRTDNGTAAAPLIMVGIAALLVVAALVAGTKAFVASQKTKIVTPVSQSLPTPTIPAAPAIQAVEPPLDAGETRVKELLMMHGAEQCKTVLLAPTRIVGGRAIEAKLVANGPCVRVLAATGTAGDQLELTMQSPAGKRVETPEAAAELDFLYCARHAGLYTAAIRSTSERPFTVSSIECPKH